MERNRVEEMLEQERKKYDQMEVPGELHDRVLQGIKEGERLRKKQQTSFIWIKA